MPPVEWKKANQKLIPESLHSTGDLHDRLRIDLDVELAVGTRCWCEER